MTKKNVKKPEGVIISALDISYDRSESKLVGIITTTSDSGVESEVTTNDFDKIVAAMQYMSIKKKSSISDLIANDTITIHKNAKTSKGIILAEEKVIKAKGSTKSKTETEYYRYFFDPTNPQLFRKGEKVDNKDGIHMTNVNYKKSFAIVAIGLVLLAGGIFGIESIAKIDSKKTKGNENKKPNKNIEEQESNEANKDIEINGVSFSDPVEEAKEAQEVVVPARDIGIEDFGGSIREFNQYSLTQIKKACADGIECRFWKYVPDEDQETVQFINDVRNDFSNGRISSNSLMNYYLNYFNGASFKNNSNYKQFYELTTLGKLAVIISSKTILPYVDNQFSAKISGIECNKDEIEDVLNAIYEAYNADFEAEYGYGGK